MSWSDYSNLDEVVGDKSNSVQESLIKFISTEPIFSNKSIAFLAKALEVQPDILESEIITLLYSLFAEGKSKGNKKDYDKNQLNRGIEVEMEHTTNPIIAEKIAKDHLSELPDYYTRLDKLERDAGVIV